MHMHNEPQQWTETIMGCSWDGLVALFKPELQVTSLELGLPRAWIAG